MRTVCLLNGSLRGRSSSSLAFLNDLRARLEPASFRAEPLAVRPSARGGYPAEAVARLAEAEAIVMAFPLFAYTLPGGLTRLLEEFDDHVRAGGAHRRGAKVYAIVNCGFPDPAINAEAIRVVRNFCRRLDLRYRFTIAVGTGPATVATRRLPLLYRGLKRAYARIVRDLEDGEAGELPDVFVRPAIPKAILLKIKEHYERKGGLTS